MAWGQSWAGARTAWISDCSNRDIKGSGSYWMRRQFGIAALFLFSMVLGLPALAQQTAGEVARFRGTAEALSGAAARPLAAGSPILVGDTIQTGEETRAEIRFLDGTLLRLGDNSGVTVTEFLYDSDRSLGRMALDLAAGVFRTITSSSTIFQQDAFLVTTPTASIGIRGTDFWGQQSAERLQVALLDDSVVVVSNASGSIVLSEPLQTTIVTSSTDAPSAAVTLTDEQLRAAAATVEF